MLPARRLAVGVVRHRRGVAGAMPTHHPPTPRPPPPQPAPIGIHCATDAAATALLSSASAALLGASASQAVHVYAPAESAVAAAAASAAAAAEAAVPSTALAAPPVTAPFHPPTYHAALRTRSLGAILLHTPVTGSTQDLLRAPPLGPALPSGAVAVADTQTGGRGRRSAVWESPAGGLAASVLLRVPAASAATAATLVHLQYAAGLAVVAALRRVWGWPPAGVRVKWPNDVYVVPSDGATDGARVANGGGGGGGGGGGDGGGAGVGGVKVGGVLVEATVRGGSVAAVVGLGVNVANAAPTTSLVAAAAAAGVDVTGGGGGGGNAPTLSREALLGATLTELERLTDALSAGGWDTPGGVRAQYEAAWMHRGQRVALPRGVGGGGRRGVVRGLDAEGNICVAVDGGGVAKLDAATTSFDVLAGALREKVARPRGGGGGGEIGREWNTNKNVRAAGDGLLPPCTDDRRTQAPTFPRRAPIYPYESGRSAAPTNPPQQPRAALTSSSSTPPPCPPYHAPYSFTRPWRAPPLPCAAWRGGLPGPPHRVRTHPPPRAPAAPPPRPGHSSCR